MEQRKVTAPYKPHLEMAHDTKHFHPEFTTMIMSPHEEGINEHEGDHEHGWKGFSFSNNEEILEFP